MARNINVQIRGNSQAFGAAVNQAKTSLGGLRSALRSMPGLDGILGGIGAGVIARQFQQFVNHADEIGKASDRIGMSTEGFQRWSYAAERSGASARDVEIAVSSLQRRMAAPLSARMEHSLNGLGLKYDELVRKTPAGQFEAVMRAAAAIEDPTLRSGLAMGILGDSGRNLIPILRDGVEGMEKLKSEAAVMSDQVIESAARMNDSLTSMKNQMTSWAASSFEFVEDVGGFLGAFSVTGSISKSLDILQEGKNEAKLERETKQRRAAEAAEASADLRAREAEMRAQEEKAAADLKIYEEFVKARADAGEAMQTLFSDWTEDGYWQIAFGRLDAGILKTQAGMKALMENFEHLGNQNAERGLERFMIGVEQRLKTINQEFDKIGFKRNMDWEKLLNPTERNKRRREVEADEQLAEKLQKLDRGERVHLSAEERKRLREMDKLAKEQEKLEKAGVARGALQEFARAGEKGKLINVIEMDAKRAGGVIDHGAAQVAAVEQLQKATAVGNESLKKIEKVLVGAH